MTNSGRVGSGDVDGLHLAGMCPAPATADTRTGRCGEQERSTATKQLRRSAIESRRADGESLAANYGAIPPRQGSGDHVAD